MTRSSSLFVLVLASTPLACGDATGVDDTDAGSTSAGEETDAPTTSETSGEAEDGLDRSPIETLCRAGDEPSDPFIDCVESFHSQDASFGHDALPGVVLGPPRGGGRKNGSVDVVSLGCDGVITLFFDEPAIVDGPGPDFIVFENPFDTGSSNFIEPARVLVSADGIDWRAFPCDPPQGAPLGCAGITPVLSHPDNGIDPTDPAVAGGDAFDLADVDLRYARYVRIQDVSVAHYGARTWCGGAGGGFDLDAIAAVHAP